MLQKTSTFQPKRKRPHLRLLNNTTLPLILTKTLLIMASRGEARFGTTGPLSEALPTEDENRKTDSLKEELRRQNNYESAADTHKRYVQRDFYYTPVGKVLLFNPKFALP